ncbi:putative phage tail protein [Levilactobacillus hammesii]|uniref:DUF2313 domain-containing protein n=1 Tax=Levilactobacillus hammesii DSM 16381 TaxID=1423753 RepID=A0A0R1UVA7_9LACO|nr:putative phage tail protein [Levilactobacillus hammesii]KRL95578.1 hypothetical protein FD28_GL002551 [Levilactobacillus hammesii DSM 16381]
MVKLKEYLPDYYDGVREMQRLMEVEQKQADGFDDMATRILMNQFVSTADSDGLSIFENQLGLPTDLNQSLESRRYDIMVRLLPPRPITIWYFRELLASMDIPATVDQDAIRNHVTTMSEADDITPEQIKRLRYLLNVMLPADQTYQIQTQANVMTTQSIFMGGSTQTYTKATIMPKTLRTAVVRQPQYFGGIKSQIYVRTTIKGGDENQ